ncbi:hypothetical protein [Micromonospora sp. URMC 103]|uniref:hypothetical protein n=1 Tax=Micromonospora sp. URMC 103 TaxID=3423406 RepID=UPI003F1B55F7
MPDQNLDLLRYLLNSQGYDLNPEQFPEACVKQPEQICALLSAAATIAATGAQMSVLTYAADLLCDVHGDRHNTTHSLREHLEVADALTAALTQHDKATAALRRTCQALSRTGELVTVAPSGSAAPVGHTDDAPDSTP